MCSEKLIKADEQGVYSTQLREGTVDNSCYYREHKVSTGKSRMNHDTTNCPGLKPGSQELAKRWIHKTKKNEKKYIYIFCNRSAVDSEGYWYKLIKSIRALHNSYQVHGFKGSYLCTCTRRFYLIPGEVVFASLSPYTP